jgi:hypothetical protein
MVYKNYNTSRLITYFLFFCFLILNIKYFVGCFFSVFLNPIGNADEYYKNILYDFSTLSFQKFSSVPSQPFIFLASFINLFLHNGQMATRVVSFILSLIFLYYLYKKVIKTKLNNFEKTIQFVFLCCMVFITSQCFSGTSDFLALVLMVIVLENFLLIFEQDSKYSFFKNIFTGFLLGIAICVRPTTLVILVCFVFCLLFFYRIQFLKNKSIYIIGLTSSLIIILINLYPIVNQHRLVLDIKEIPKNTGTSWFEMNYLMAKKWDTNEIPRTKWLSHLDVIKYKKENPKAFIPKSYLDLVTHEPKLYTKQMARMFIMANYTNLRFMYLLFPLLFIVFITTNYNASERLRMLFLEEKFPIISKSYKIVLVTHILSIIVFSFLAIKLFEPRWVMPTMILYLFYSLQFLCFFKKKVRYFVYNFSFILGILFFIKNLV